MKSTGIQIDIAKLAARLSRESDGQFGIGDVQTWLSARGFRPAGENWWGCGEAVLSHLRSDEITHIRLHVSDGAVTFVEDPRPRSA